MRLLIPTERKSNEHIETPINIPPGRSGQYEIRKNTFEEITYQISDGPETVSRSAAHSLVRLAGLKSSVIIDDAPIELVRLHRSAKHLHGRILIGGLGLGIIIGFIDYKTCGVVTVVEISRDVASLVFPHVKFSKAIGISVNDIATFINENDLAEYDTAYIDVCEEFDKKEPAIDDYFNLIDLMKRSNFSGYCEIFPMHLLIKTIFKRIMKYRPATIDEAIDQISNDRLREEAIICKEKSNAKSFQILERLMIKHIREVAP